MKIAARSARLASVFLLLSTTEALPDQGGPAAKPVIVVVAQNGGTEPTDFLVPFGLISGSGVADVYAVALNAGAVTLHPTNTLVELPHTIATFDASHPQGADYVIVPAVHHPDDAQLAAWLRSQRTHGAVVMSICDGAKVLAHAGLLKGRTATAHWYALKDLRRQFPETTWRDDRRYVFDGEVFTTSGVSASVPATLALLERIAGTQWAAQYARSLGISAWSAEHNGVAFQLSGKAVRTAAGNQLAFWRHERLALVLPDQIDEARAAFIMDAYARTYRSSVELRSEDSKEIHTRHGLIFRPQEGRADRTIDRTLVGLPLAQTLDAALARIEIDYGTATADFVALQLEHVRNTTPHVVAPDGTD